VLIQGVHMTDFIKPFHLVAHKGLGKEETWVPSFLPSTQLGQANVDVAVNAATGNVCITDHQLSFPDIGTNIEVSMVHNSLSSESPWRLAYGRAIKEFRRNQSVKITERDGREVEYQFDALTNSYIASDGSDGKPSIIFDDRSQNYSWYHPKSRVTEYFDKEGFLLRRIEPTGNETRYEYFRNELIAIVAPSKTRYEFQRDGNVTKVFYNNGKESKLLHQYEIDMAKKAMKSTTSDGYETIYQGNNNFQVEKITQTDGSMLQLSYYTDASSKNKIKTLQLGDEDAANTITYGNDATTFADTANNKSIFTFNDAQNTRLFSVMNEFIQYNYNTKNQIESIQYADGSVEKFSYQSSGLIETHTKRDGSIEKYRYSEGAPLLLAVEKYQPGDTHPAAVERYVYDKNNHANAALLRFIISANGRVKERCYDQDGLVAEEKQYIHDFYLTDWQKNPTLEEMQKWSASLKNEKAEEKTASIEFNYDNQGRPEKIIAYAKAAAKQVNLADATTHITTFVHDERGHLKSESLHYDQQSSLDSTYEHNALGHLLKKELAGNTALGQLEKTSYSANTIHTVLPNGREEIRELNSQGRIKKLTSKVGDEVRESQYQPVASEKVVFEALPDGNKNTLFYDEKDRLSATLSPAGSVVRYSYDPKTRCQTRTQFAKTLDVSSLYPTQSYFSFAWLTGQPQKPSAALFNKALENLNSDNDARVSYLFSDVNGKPQYEIDAAGYVTEHRYHLSGKESHLIRYHEALLPEEHAALLAGKGLQRKPDRTKDEVTSTFHDADGYEIAVQNPNGYVTEFIRDAAGRVIEKIAYENKNVLMADQIDAVRPQSHPEDAHTYCFNNGLDQNILEVDAEGIMTTFSYYADGKLKESKRYATPVAKSWYDNRHVLPVPVTSENDLTISYQYDALRRVSEKHFSTGKVTTYAYDTDDHIIAEYTHDEWSPLATNGDHCRGREEQFDAWGQKKLFANPLVAEKLAAINISNLPEEEKIRERSVVFKQFADKFEYNKIGLPIKKTDSTGLSTYYFYDKDKHPLYAIKSSGKVVAYTINGFGERTSKRKLYNKLSKDQVLQLTGGYVEQSLKSLLAKIYDDKKDAITQYQRNNRGLIEKLIDPENNISQFTYDAFKRCTKKELPVNGKEPSLTIDTEFDLNGNETKQTKTGVNQPSRVTQKSYDRFNCIKEEWDAVGCHTKHVIDKLGRLTKTEKSVAENEYITTVDLQLDAFGRPTKMTDADNNTTCIDYQQSDRSQLIHHADGVSKTKITTNIFNEATRKQDGALENNNNHDDIFSVLQEERVKHAPHGGISEKWQGDQQIVANAFDIKGKLQSELLKGSAAKVNYERNDDGYINKKIIDAGENKLNLTTSMEVNAFGQAEKIIDSNKIATKNEFDRKGNVVKSIQDENGLNLVKKNQYNAQNQLLETFAGDKANETQAHHQTIINDFGQVEKETTDPAGLQISQQYTYDAAGKVIKKTDPNGNETRIFFDLLGRKRFKTKVLDDDSLSVIEYDYTATGQRRTVRTLDKPIEKNAISDLTALKDIKNLVQYSTNDTITHSLFDANGRERFKLSLIYSDVASSYQAIVEEKEYNAAGKEIKTSFLYNPIDASDWQTVTTEQFAQTVKLRRTDKDRTHYRWYDQAGRECLTIDQDGRVTQREYNSAGKVIAETQFDTLVQKVASLTSLPFEQILANIPKNTERDRTDYSVYDNIGRFVFEVKPNKSVFAYQYDANNNPILECKFKDKFNATFTNYDDLVAKLGKLVPQQAYDAVIEKKYDNANRLTDIIDYTKPDNDDNNNDLVQHKDHYTYDGVGNLNTHLDRDGNQWTYVSDKAKRLTDKISPSVAVTTVIRDESGKLVHQASIKQIAQTTVFDKAGNANELIEASNVPAARHLHTKHNAQRKLVKTEIKDIHIDDDSSYQSDWDNLKKLPEKTATIDTNIIYNTKGKKIAEKNENNVWSYYIYDSAERLIAEIKNGRAVTRYTYNAFNEIEGKYEYVNLLNIDLSPYQKTGVPIELLNANVKLGEKDKQTDYQYDGTGKCIHSESNDVFYYADGVYGFAKPESKKAYNTFGDLIYSATLVRPDVWAEKFYWYDQAGNVIAEVDGNNYVTRYEVNAAGKEIERREYATKLATPMTWLMASQLSVTELDKLITASSKDRIYQSDYDQNNLKTSEKLLNVVTQHLEFDANGCPFLVDNEPTTLTKTWEFTASGLEKCFTNEAGGKSYQFYDERGLLKAKTSPTFTNIYNKNEKITPLIVLHRDEFGQIVVKQESTKGCAFVDKNTLPAFVDANDVIETTLLLDNRGLPVFKQDAENHLEAATYTPLREVKRELELINNWQPVDATFVQVPHVAEIKHERNDLSQEIKKSYVLEGQLEDAILTQQDRYGHVLTETDADHPEGFAQKMDMHGRAWFTQEENGAKVIQLHDLRGHVTLKLKSPEKNLAEINYADLPKLMEWNTTDLLRTESVLDAAGQPVGLKSPQWFSKKLKNLSHSSERDRWGNVVKEIDSLGNVNEYEFNHLNKMIKHIQPEVTIVNEKGESYRDRPVTEFGYNKLGCQIGLKDANGNTSACVYDEAGQLAAEIDADGVYQSRYIRDANGKVIATLNSRDKVFSAINNKLGQHTDFNFPTGRTIKRTHDGKRGISSETDDRGNTTRYNHDVRGNVSQRILPQGQTYTMELDHNHEQVKITNPDGKSLEWKRDYFSNPLTHKDLEERQYEILYNQNKQPVIKHAIQFHPWQMQHLLMEYKVWGGLPCYFYNLMVNDAKAQDIQYQYEDGLLTKINNFGDGRYTKIQNDTENRRTDLVMFGNDGEELPIYRAHTDYDELGRTSLSTNDHLLFQMTQGKTSAKQSYDAVGNVRRMQLEINIPGLLSTCPSHQQSVDAWFSYTKSNKTLINNGDLNGNQIVPSARGVVLDYKHGLRDSERWYLDQTTLSVETKIGYHDDGLLYTTTASNGVSTERNYQDGWLYDFRESYGGAYREHVINPTANGWQYLEQENAPGVNYSESEYQTDDMGLPQSEKLTTFKPDGKREWVSIDTKTYHYIGYDTKQLSSVDISRKTRDGEGPIGTANYFRASDSTVNGKRGSEDENAISTKADAYYDLLPEGIFLNKKVIGLNVSTNFPDTYRGYHYLASVNNEIAGGYFSDYSPAMAVEENVGHQHGNHGTTDWVNQNRPLLVRTPIEPIGQTDYHDRNIPRVNDPLDWTGVLPPALGPQAYVVQNRDTLESIAQNQLGSKEHAEFLGLTNGIMLTDEILKPGMVIQLPQVLASHHQSNDSRPYHEFMNVLMGVLSPHVITPQPKATTSGHAKKPHRHWFGIIAKIVAIAVIAIVAPHIAAYLLGVTVATLGVTGAVLTGVIAAVADGGVQALSGSHISIAEMLETGVTAGVGVLLPGMAGWKEGAETIFGAMSANVATQLIEMRLDLRKNFDVKSLLMQAGAMATAAGIAKLDSLQEGLMREVVETSTNTASNAFLSKQLYGGSTDLQMLAASALGSVIAQEGAKMVQDKLSPKTTTTASNNAAHPATTKTNANTNPNKTNTNNSNNKSHSSRLFQQPKQTTKTQPAKKPISSHEIKSHEAKLKLSEQEEMDVAMRKVDEPGLPVANKNTSQMKTKTTETFAGGLKKSVAEAYKSPDNWAAATAKEIEKLGSVMSSEYSKRSFQAQVASVGAMKRPVIDTLAAEVGHDVNLNISRAQKVLGEAYSHAGAYAKGISFFAKAVPVVDIGSKIREVAVSEKRLRTGFVKGAEFAGEEAGAFLGALAIETTAIPSMGLSLIATPTVVVGTSAAVGYMFKAGAEEGYDYLSRKFGK
jgi:YD repeat-containing protein